MTHSLAVTAGEGLGNSFVLVRREDAEHTGVPLPDLARRLCGQWVDGMLVMGKFRDGTRQVEIFNRDGSEGGACLNGLRVAALWTARDDGHFTMNGRPVEWRRVKDGVELHLLKAGMPEEISVEPVDLGEHQGVKVGFWNPHCIVPVEHLRDVNLEELASRAAENTEQFPDGVNLDLVQEGGEGRVRMRTWERGVGETMACGSGAVAVTLAAWAGGKPERTEVHMIGGHLVLEPAPDGGLLLTGRAHLEPPRDVFLD